MASRWSLEPAGQFDFGGVIAGSAFAAIALLVGVVSLASISAGTKRFAQWRTKGYMWFWAGAIVLSIVHFAVAFASGLSVFFIKAPSAFIVQFGVVQLASGALALIIVSTPMLALALRSDADLY
jgi:hypothetical protein